MPERLGRCFVRHARVGRRRMGRLGAVGWLYFAPSQRRFDPDCGRFQEMPL